MSLTTMLGLGPKLTNAKSLSALVSEPNDSNAAGPVRDDSLNITGMAPLLLEFQLLVFAVLIGCWTSAWYSVAPVGYCVQVPVVVAADAGDASRPATTSDASAKLTLKFRIRFIPDPFVIGRM